MRVEKKKNTIKGSMWGIFNRVICTIFPFIIRTIIIKEFGEKYLGLNSLFSSVLQVLNLSELGITNSIVYSMYRPIAEDDNEQLCALLAFYKRLYLYIGIFILTAGCLLMPFLKFFISGDYPREINIYLLYILFLMNTCSSYFFFGYKEAVLSAYQKHDIINSVRMVTYLFQFILQILIIIVLKDYYLYVSMLIVFTILRSYASSKIVDKKYPSIKARGKLEKQELKGIRVNMMGVTLGKLCTVSRGTLDEIIMSSFLGLSALAVFDNYYYIISALVAIMNVIENSMISGVGNSMVLDSQEKNYMDFKKINFIYMWLAGVSVICVICLYQPFMKLWVGEKLMVDTTVMLLFGLYFYTGCFCSISNVYLTASGQWWNLKVKSIFEVIINCSLNIILVRLLGMAGIIIATIISYIFISFIWGSFVLYKNYFTEQRLISLIVTMGGHCILTCLMAISIFFVCIHLNFDSLIVTCAVRLFCCLILSNLIYFLIFRNNKYYQYLKNNILRLVIK